MSPAPVNLVNLERVHVSFGITTLLDSVSLGVAAGERIGVVGRNGSGKTTLLRLLAHRLAPHGGRVTRTRGLRLGSLAQVDDLVEAATVRHTVLGDRPDHEWATDPRARAAVWHLLAGVDLDRPVGALSGGERRRTALAALLLGEHDLLLLDEPSNHLDLESVDWLASHLVGLSSALVVVTHDRWFLDAVCTRMWEVHDAGVDAFTGGYAAYVLAKVERERQATARQARRRNLLRKELAWLRRGAPARTTKPTFRLEAAAALVAEEPAPRDRLELERFAVQRLGKDVLDVEDVTLRRGDRVVLDAVTWRLGPGERVGLVGVNGAGKTSVLRLLAGSLDPVRGRVRRGRTARIAHLSQGPAAIDPAVRVLEAVEQVSRVGRTGRGEVSAAALLERFGFTRLETRVGELSGGERRRLQLLRLLLDGPNVLLLDEPTNDLDVETLTVLEDHLDSWPGTLVVVSHDRYFLERVCDTVWALPGDGSLRMLPRGVDQYLELVREPARAGPAPSLATGASAPGSGSAVGASAPGSALSAVQRRAAHKQAERLERQLERVSRAEADLHDQMALSARDHVALIDLGERAAELARERAELEERWLHAAELAET